MLLFRRRICALRVHSLVLDSQTGTVYCSLLFLFTKFHEPLISSLKFLPILCLLYLLHDYLLNVSFPFSGPDYIMNIIYLHQRCLSYRWPGCTDLGCELCRQTVKRCFHDLAAAQVFKCNGANDSNSIPAAQIKADCGISPSAVILANPGQNPHPLGDCIPDYLQVILSI